MGNFGLIELVLFFGLAVSFTAWQYWSTDRVLKQTRAERAAREAAEREGGKSGT